MKKELDHLFNRLSKTDSHLLLLDFDGTLAPFRKDRDIAFPYKGVEERLDKLIASSKTTVVIISGRVIKDLKPLLKLEKYPEIWGSHGWENLSEDGIYSILERDKYHLMGLSEAKKYIHDNDLQGYMEVKPASIAIHFREVHPNKALEIEKNILHNWEELEAGFHLVCSRFDGGLELRIPGFDKGQVVKTILKRYSESTLTAYLGDDITDEDAFRALPDSALGVLVRKEPRETAAKVRIEPPAELLWFLDRWISADESN